MRTRYLRAALAITILLSLAVSPAMGFADEVKGPSTTGVRPAANTAVPDAYENDDWCTDTLAKDVTANIPAAGAGFYTQAHTIDEALGTAYDQDWYYFDVTDAEIAIDEVRFLIEAVSYDQGVDLVVEVYATSAVVGDPVTGGFMVDPSAIASSDDALPGTPNPAVGFVPLTADRYWIRVRPLYNGSFTGKAGAYTFKIQRTLSERVAGSDRIATAVQVSKVGISTAAVASRAERTILIVNSMNYPDALSGASLVNANGWGGSLLLTPKDSLPGAVAAEIVRSGTQYVYVLGGPSAVSDPVVWQLEAINPGIVVERVSGADRIKTSTAIAREGFSRLGARRFVIIAYAFNYPDALAATPISAYTRTPVLLTPTNALPADTLTAMYDIGVTDIIIVGGPTVVSDNVFTQCAAYAGGADHVLRIAGANRYETAKEIALWSCDLKGPGVRGNGLIGTAANPAGLGAVSTQHLGLASGENFPDALSGGVLAGTKGFPILLTPKASLSPYIYDIYLDLPAGKTDFFNDAGSPLRSGVSYVFGSESAVQALPLLNFSMMLGY
jgi:putative cell wall-binding protein